MAENHNSTETSAESISKINDDRLRWIESLASKLVEISTAWANISIPDRGHPNYIIPMIDRFQSELFIPVEEVEAFEELANLNDDINATFLTIRTQIYMLQEDIWAYLPGPPEFSTRRQTTIYTVIENPDRG